MCYYDIHTHRPSTSYPEDIAIVSVDISKPFVPSVLKYSVGIHPWHIDYNDRDTNSHLFEKVREYAQLPSVVAIGETGLDKITAKTTHDFHVQQTYFTMHIRLAEEVKKPMIIHCVRAWDELVHIHQSVNPSVPWVVHGFRGNETLALRLLNVGFYLSFGLHYHIASLKAAWSKQRLFAETDDNPITIRDVYQQIANDLTISVQELKRLLPCSICEGAPRI